MIIKNASVYTPEHTFAVRDIAIRDGRFLFAVPEQPAPGEEVLDAAGMYALPGLVDIHLHGNSGGINEDHCAGTTPAPVETPKPVETPTPLVFGDAIHAPPPSAAPAAAPT